MLRCIRISKNKDLIKRYEQFFREQLDYYHENVFDERRGLVRLDKNFSSIKDNSQRKSSCYDNCMLGLLKEELKGTGLENPFKQYNIKKNIKEKFWSGEHFFDVGDRRHVAGDANTFPYWTELFSSVKMIKSSTDLRPNRAK